MSAYCLSLLFSGSPSLFSAVAQEPSPAPTNKTAQTERVSEIKLGYHRAYAPQLALSVLDVRPRDEGVAGAKVAIGNNLSRRSFCRYPISLAIRTS